MLHTTRVYCVKCRKFQCPKCTGADLGRIAPEARHPDAAARIGRILEEPPAKQLAVDDGRTATPEVTVIVLNRGVRTERPDRID